MNNRQNRQLEYYVGTDLWILIGEYRFGTSYYVQILDADSYSVRVKLIPESDVVEENKFYSLGVINTPYTLSRDDIWFDTSEVLTTDEILYYVWNGK